MIEINLLPDIKQELLRVRHVRSTVVAMSVLIGSVSIAIVGLLALYAFTVQPVRNMIADSKIKDGEKTLIKSDDNKDLSGLLTIQNQLTKLTTINNQKNITSRFLAMLKAIAPAPPNNITISSLNIDIANKSVSLDGQAENSFSAVEVFRKTIEGTNFTYVDSDKNEQKVSLASDVATSNTSYGEDSSGIRLLRFNLNFTYTPELFSIASKDAKVIGPDGKDVTDSYLGAQSIFAVRAKDIKEEK